MDDQLPSPEQMKEDLANCPPWILARLKSEREMRRKLAEQTAEQTEALSGEVNEWRNKAFLYKSQLDELQLEKASRDEELDRLKEMAKKAVNTLKEELRKKDEELKKKGEILEMLKHRLQQQMNNPSAPTTPPSPAPTTNPSDIDKKPVTNLNLTNSQERPLPHAPQSARALGGSSPILTQSKSARGVTFHGSAITKSDAEKKPVPGSPVPPMRSPSTISAIVSPRRETEPPSASNVEKPEWDSVGALPDLAREIERAKERLNKNERPKDPSKYRDVITLAQIKPILQAPEFRRKLILKLMLEDDVEAVMCLFEAVDVNTAKIIAQSIVTLFVHNGNIFALLKGVVNREITTTQEIGTLFRATSIASKLMGQYVRMVGNDFLIAMLNPLLVAVAAEDKDLETDTFRAENLTETILQQRVTDLGNICSAFMERVFSMIDQCPPQLRRLAHILNTGVMKKFPDSDWPVAVGGFFFLRYVCPAIVSPETVSPELGKIIANTKNVRRTLVLISKILQNLANGTKIFKEPFMMCMGSWVAEKLPPCKEFFLNFIQVPKGAPEATVMVEQTPLEAFMVISTHLDKNRPKFIENLTSQPQKPHLAKMELPLYERLRLIVEALGEPKTNVTQIKECQEVLTQLEDLIVNDNLLVATALSNASAVPLSSSGAMVDWGHRIAEALVLVFESKGKVVNLIAHQVELEQNQTSPLEPLNRMSLKMFGSYCRHLCRQYLTDVLAPHITPIVTQNLFLEIEHKESISAQYDIEGNQKRLTEIIRDLTKDILNSLAGAPRPLWRIGSLITEKVANSQDKKFAMAQFLFTGLFVPALRSPQTYGIIKETPKKESLRTLELISKVYQHITSPEGSMFGKNTTMQQSLSTINTFIRSSAQAVNFFIDKWLSTVVSEECKYPSSCGIPWGDKFSPLQEKAMSTLQGFLYENLALMKQQVGTAQTSVTVRYVLPELWDALLKYVQLAPISSNGAASSSPSDASASGQSKKELKKKEKEEKKKEKEKEKEEKKKEKEEKKKNKANKAFYPSTPLSHTGN